MGTEKNQRGDDEGGGFLSERSGMGREGKGKLEKKSYVEREQSNTMQRGGWRCSKPHT